MTDNLTYESWEQLIGQCIGPDGRYLVRRRVGEGGMGMVFEAYEEAKDRTIAIKILNPDVSSDHEILQRFKREGSKFSRARHPNIVRVFGMGRARGLLYIASEFVGGRNLYEILKEEGPMDIDRALEVISESAAGLHVAHAEGIIHRDLKPENIMVTDEGNMVKILDFGIAKDLNASMALTLKGSYLGTVGYSAPEQIRGDEIDHRADIFSLGVILYELVTGEVPFKGRRTNEILTNTIKADPVNPGRLNDEVSAPVGRLIAKMIAKKPRQRIQDCGEVVERIEGVRRVLADPSLERGGSGVVRFLTNLFGGD